MGSTRIDADRRALTHERREARIARKQQRRRARELKRSQIAAAPYEPEPQPPSATQQHARQQVRGAVDELDDSALERHDQRAAPAATQPSLLPVATAVSGLDRDLEPSAPLVDGGGRVRVGRREREIGEFRERRQRIVNDARAEARVRIARAGEPAAVADALAALADPSAGAWKLEREQLDRALRDANTGAVAATARQALWAVSRDAARSSRRATRDPELAAAVCVAYAIVARLARSAVRATQRTNGAQSAWRGVRRAFWR
ncbi:MAG: hypothetical protein ABSG43_14450 [Solirubrobacteraceae bacterium]|jgi:hypothetical protein